MEVVQEQLQEVEVKSARFDKEIGVSKAKEKDTRRASGQGYAGNKEKPAQSKG